MYRPRHILQGADRRAVTASGRDACAQMLDTSACRFALKTRVIQDSLSHTYGLSDCWNIAGLLERQSP